MKFLLMMLAATTVTLAGDKSITGTWEVQTEIMGNENMTVCTLTQDSNKVTGKCTVNGADQAVKGEITDQKVTFQHGGEYNGEALTIIYSGTFDSPTALTGEVNVQPFDVSGTFKAKKKE
jgi:hypothetical protein